MKIPPRKTIQLKLPKVDHSRIDRAAERFLDNKAHKQTAEENYDHAYAQVLEYADSNAATETEKGRTIEGNLYKMGFTNILAKPTIDPEVLKKVLRTKQSTIKALLQRSVTEVVDEQAFLAYVDSGRITKAEAEKCISPGGVKGRRVFVERK